MILAWLFILLMAHEQKFHRRLDHWSVEHTPHFINAASIDSPGIAASPAIAIDVVKMLSEAGANVNADQHSIQTDHRLFK